MKKGKDTKKLISFFDRADIYPWTFTFADELLTKEIAKIANGKKCSIIIERFKRGHLYHYINVQEFNVLALEFIKQIQFDKSFSKMILKNVYVLSNDLNKFSDKIFKGKWVQKSNKDLIKILGDYIIHLKKLRLYGWVPPIVDGLTEPFLSDLCIELITNDFEKLRQDQSKIKQIYSTLSAPKKFGQVQMSEIEKLNLIKRIGKVGYEKMRKESLETSLEKLPNGILRQLSEYVHKYSWLTYNYEGPVFTMEMLFNDFKNIGYREALVHLKKINANKRELIKEKGNILKKYKLSVETKRILNVASESALLKEYRKAIYQYSYVAMDLVIEEVAKRANTTINSLKFLTLDEIAAVLNGAKIDKYLKRQNDLLVKIENGVSEFYSGGDVEKMLAKYEKKVQAETQTIFKGQVAFPGKVKGRAKIIMATSDLMKMEPGDILVSSSTNPDLLSAMKIAGAIVTDMGGITCHAAIVSRELRIPCVVGTRNITKQIQDGDLLMVDAQNGIVTKLANDNK